MSVAYDPLGQYEIKVWDVEYRRDPVRTLMARIYQPQGPGPFPTLLDVHGGAWNDQDRTANAPVDEKLAAPWASKGRRTDTIDEWCVWD